MRDYQVSFYYTENDMSKIKLMGNADSKRLQR